jgi:hypothetical protein
VGGGGEKERGCGRGKDARLSPTRWRSLLYLTPRHRNASSLIVCCRERERRSKVGEAESPRSGGNGDAEEGESSRRR